jgi:cell division protein FtsN
LAGGVSTIGAVARNGPRDDFHNQATQHGDWARGGPPPSEQSPPTDPPPEGPDRFAQTEISQRLDDEDAEPTPWYRKPVLLIGWLVFVLILIGLIIYGLMELIQGDQGISRTPKTTTTSTTTPTTSPTTTPSTTTTTPSSSGAVAPPAQQPTQQPTRQPSQQEPTHHHHLPQLPSVITIPQVPTVITVPPGLR